MNRLQQILHDNTHQRIVVVGTTCIGKTTLAKTIPGAVDIDDVLFPLLTQEELDIVCDSPWTPEIGRYMSQLIQEKIVVTAGHPLFAPDIVDCDFIIYLRARHKATLKKRCADREVSFHTAMAMDNQILERLKEVRLPVMTVYVEGLYI